MTELPTIKYISTQKHSVPHSRPLYYRNHPQFLYSNRLKCLEQCWGHHCQIKASNKMKPNELSQMIPTFAIIMQVEAYMDICIRILLI